MNAQRYSGVAMLLHWAIAIAVIVNWRIAEAAEHATSREEGFAIMANHKALGITILVLSVLRLLWRFTHRPPDLASTLKTWERTLARAVHVIFYVLLIGLPIGGWMASSMYGFGVDYWGLFSLPPLPVGVNEDLGHEIGEMHGAGGKILLLLVLLHVVGALKHTIIDKDGNLWRMLPFGTPKG